MAFASSGLYGLTMIKALKNTTGIDLSLTTSKYALYTNTLTPNYDTDTTYSATNEVSGTGYTATGQAIVTPTVTLSSGVITWTFANPAWTSSTITAHGGIVYCAGLANELELGQTFGADVTSTAATFTVTISGSGAMTWAYR